LAEWALVVAITVVVVAVRVLLIVVTNLTKEGVKFFLSWSRHSSEFRRNAILPDSFYDPVYATEADTYRNFSNICVLKSYNSSHLEPRKLPTYAFEDIFQY
jgi:hypothetical protein